MKRKSDSLVYTLTRGWVIFLLIYYFSILLLGIIFSIYIILNLNNISDKNILLKTIIASLSVSGMFCSIQYLKRIYKACLEERIVSENHKAIVLFGNILYFLLRPVFTFVFVIIAIFAMLSGFVIISNSIDYLLNIRFLYLSVIVSSFIGYSIGKVLDKFELLSESKISEYINKAMEGKKDD